MFDTITKSANEHDLAVQIGSSDVLYLHRFMIEQWEFFETLEKGIYDCEIPIASFKVLKEI